MREKCIANTLDHIHEHKQIIEMILSPIKWNTQFNSPSRLRRVCQRCWQSVCVSYQKLALFSCCRRVLTCDEFDLRNELRKNVENDGKKLPYERFGRLPELELEFVLTLSMLGERSRVGFNGIRSGLFRERTTFRNRNNRRTFFILFKCFLQSITFSLSFQIFSTKKTEKPMCSKLVSLE